MLTNNPAKVAALERHGIQVSARVPIVVGAHPENLRYLGTKRDRMGHHLIEPMPGGLARSTRCGRRAVPRRFRLRWHRTAPSDAVASAR